MLQNLQFKRHHLSLPLPFVSLMRHILSHQPQAATRQQHPSCHGENGSHVVPSYKVLDRAPVDRRPLETRQLFPRSIYSIDNRSRHSANALRVDKTPYLYSTVTSTGYLPLTSGTHYPIAPYLKENNEFDRQLRSEESMMQSRSRSTPQKLLLREQSRPTLGTVRTIPRQLSSKSSASASSAARITLRHYLLLPNGGKVEPSLSALGSHAQQQKQLQSAQQLCSEYPSLSKSLSVMPASLPDPATKSIRQGKGAMAVDAIGLPTLRCRIRENQSVERDWLSFERHRACHEKLMLTE